VTYIKTIQKLNFIAGMKPKTFFRYILINLFALIFTGSLLKSQTPLRIMPLGNSITWDEIADDTRPLGDKVAYRYQLYQLLNADGYTYNFIGSENSGGNYLPAGYADNAGFPGITAAQLLTLLQTGRNYYIDPINGFCELPLCPQNYLAYYQPDIILLHIGTNGLTDSASAPGKVASISGILDFIDAYETSSGKTIPVFLAQIINRAGSNPSGNHQPTTYFNQLLAAMVAARTSDVIRLVNMESGAGINYRYTPSGDMIDTYHPAPSGYTKMGTKWFNAIDSFNYAAPAVSDIPDQTVNEGTSFSTINLNNFVFDPQEADANITWTYSTATNLNISISPGKIATITVKNSEWNGSETVTFTAYDSGNGGAPLFSSDNVIFTVQAVNDAPVLSGIESTPISYSEGQGNVNLTSTIVINDVDNTTLSSASITITGGYLNTEDVLNFSNQSGITGSWNSSSGILTLSGTTTLANYRTALRSITYQNTNTDNPSTTPRQVNFTVNDGADNSNTVSRTINISGSNDAPVLNNIEGSAIVYSEEQSPVNITSTLNVIDADNINLASATIRIASGYVNGQDMLYFTTQNGITSSWNSGNGTLSLSGSSSVINYQTAIRSITYANLNTTNPNTASRTITFVVNDGSSSSNTVQRTLNVIAVNDPPVLGNMETSTITYTEGQGEVNVTSALTVTDVDNTTLTSASVQIVTGYVSTEDILRFTNQSGITGSWSVSTGTMSLSGTATLASYQTALRSIRYENTNVSNPSTAGRAVSFSVNDGTDNSNNVSRNISINSTNNPPVLSSIEVSALSFTEGQAPVSVTSSIIAQDVDNVNLASATVRFTSGYNNTEDLLNFVNQNGITSSWNSTSGILTLSGSSSVANYQAALRSITYSNSNNDNPSTTSRTVTFRVNDGTANSNEVSRSIAVTAVNDAPVLSDIETTALSYTEEQPAVIITNTIAVADVDNANLTSASISITGGYLNTEDVLTFSYQHGISGSWNASAGTMTLSGSATVANYQLALRSVRYQNTNTLNPSSAARTINFTVNDGTTGSIAVTRDINVFPVNDAPLLGNIETTAANYTEQATPVTITSTLTVTDYDSPTLASATVKITTGYLGTEDILRFTNQSGINGSWDGATGTLNLLGSASLANYQTALRSVSYENLNTQKPSVLPRTISFTVNDGFLLSNSVTRNITVTGVNDPPELSGIEPLAINYTEGQLPVNITSTLIVTDVDNDSLVSATIRIADNPVAGEDTLMYPVKIGNITGFYNPAAFTMTLSGGDTKIRYRDAIRSILYQNRDTLDPSTLFRTVSINVNDGTSPALAPAYRYISIIQVNDPPVAKNVGISGLKTIFTLNTITYNYVDPENDLEGTTIFTWKRSTQPGNDSATITGATAKTYLLQFADGGKYIKATVRPADIFGAQSSIAFHSPWYYVNAAPEAKNVRLGGIIAVGQTDTVRFDYADKELNDPNTSGHIYMWYRANSLPDTVNKILVATTKTYTLTALDSTRYISFAVAPVALAGSLIGDTIQSKWYGPISRLPSATISGNDTLCAGELASVKLALTGTSPWSVTYTINNLNPTVIPSIPTSDYTILTNKPGTYRVTKVSDAKFPDGIVNGTAFVGLHDTVKVTLSALGDTAICDDGVSAATLSANFTGTAPWSFVLSISGADTTYNNVVLDPFSFSSRKPGNYKIKSVSDKFCTSLTGSPKTVTVLYKPSPTATISGLDSICPGDTARLTVILNKGTLPWRFTYTVDSASPKSTPWITTSGYTLKVLNQGTYRITILSDALCTGKATGQGKVVYRSAPAANLSGGGTVCSGTSASLRVDLAGTAPWSFSYKRGSAVIDTFKSVLATPRLFTAKDPGTYALGYVHDKYCKGTVTGSVIVSVIPAPVVKISGLNQTYSVNSDPVPVYGSPVGGYFTGQGLIPRNDTMFFLPSWAGVDGSPHKITYTYQDPISGCFGKDTFMVNVLEVEADIIFPDGKDFYCFNDPPFVVTGANIVGDTGTFTISGGVGMTDNGDNTATIDPSKLSGAIYELTYTYIKDNIPLSRIEQFTVEYVNPIWFVGFNKNTYCSNDNSLRLNGNIEEGVFYGDAVSGNIVTGFYFVPSLARIGVDTIFYSHTTPKGCSRKIYEVVTINEAPQIEFTAEDTCVAAGSNDSTVFINQTTSTDEITGWLWKFDDINSGIENTSTLENPRHLYTNSGRKYISLTVATIKNCVSTREIRFNFGDKPQADFHWSTECFKEGSPVMFIDKSSIKEGEISSYKWKFHVNDQVDSMDVKNPEYTFESYGDYKVGLEVITNYGCVDTFSDIFHLRPTFILTENNPYNEDFETGMNGWVSDKSENSEANSWNFGLPTDGFIGAVGLNAWYTKIDNTKVEDSWISSPCFDFTGIKKPMIKMDMWRIFEQTRDGAVLQYRSNNEDNWYNIGDLNDGIEWYNKYSVDGKPGGQSIGWSDLKDTKWIEARHKLDDLVGLTDVQFRIAYGSNGTGTDNKGVAIDNIGIWKRNKIVLLEHFTNSSDTLCKDANEIVKSAITELNGDVVDIQYHTVFPGYDPFYLDNPTTVEVRTYYYGLLEVPYTYLDGGFTSAYRYDYRPKQLNTNDINLQSLNDPKFRIELNTEITDNSINVSATLIARKAIAPSELILHTVIIEREVTGVEGTNGETLFRNVVKAMLPNAAGTYKYRSWTAGSTELINYSWNFSNVFDVDELRVVVFVQDETTKEIYQAAVDRFDFVSATVNELSLNREFKCMVYPNPVSDYAYVRFNQPLTSDLKLDIFDNMGRLLESKIIEPHTEELLIDTYGYREGIYFIRISNGISINELLKIIVVK
jgi:hypothetical protein